MYAHASAWMAYEAVSGTKLWVSGTLDVDRPEEGIVTVEVSTAFEVAGNLVPVEHR